MHLFYKGFSCTVESKKEQEKEKEKRKKTYWNFPFFLSLFSYVLLLCKITIIHLLFALFFL